MVSILYLYGVGIVFLGVERLVIIFFLASYFFVSIFKDMLLIARPDYMLFFVFVFLFIAVCCG